MTVYWVDPYLDTSNGGIHGTTGTARSGTYSNPWGFDELYSTSSTARSSINGTNITSTDEIRLKGQSLASYYTNIGTTGNKVPITSCPSSGDALVYDSSYNTNVDTWRTAITTANSNDTVGVFVIHDPDLLGTDKWTIASSQPGAHTTGQDRIKIQPNNNRSPYSAYINALEGITSSKGLEVAFIDPAWCHDLTETSAISYLYFQSQDNTDGMTITDGWDSETTRNGVTLLIFRDNNTSSPNITMFNASNYGIKYDLPNTVLVHYHTTNYYHNKKYIFYWRHFDETYPLKLGGIANFSQNAWNYLYLSNTTSKWETGGEDYSVDIRSWAHSRYFFWNYSGNSANRPKIRIQNMFWGHGPYFHGSHHDVYVGNIFMYTTYTGADFFYTYNQTNTINVLSNAHLFGNQSQLQGFDTAGSLGTVGSGITTTPDQPAKYPGAGSGGPSFAGVKISSRYLVDMDYNIPLAPANWYDANVVKAPSNTASLSTYDYGHWNTPFGILQCDSDYNNINSRVSMVKNSYINNSFFSDQSMQFIKNTYDNKPIMLWTHVTTGTNSVYPALISFNDSDDMIVKCTNQSNAGNKNYFKSFVYDTPELTGMNTLVFEQDIIKIGTGVTTAPTVRLFPVRNALEGAGVSTSTTNSSTKWTFTHTFSANDLDSDVNFIGSSINMVNNTGADKNSGIRIKPPVFTVT